MWFCNFEWGEGLDREWFTWDSCQKQSCFECVISWLFSLQHLHRGETLFSNRRTIPTEHLSSHVWLFQIHFHPVHHHLLCKKESCSAGLHIIYRNLKKKRSCWSAAPVLLILKAITVTKQKKPVIIFTPSISGIWGTHPVFHFYPHSALSSSSCSYFYLLSSCAECTTAGWCKTGRVTWDNGAFHCCLVAAQTDSITAGYLCHLIVALCNWQHKLHTCDYSMYFSSWVRWRTWLVLTHSKVCGQVLWARKLIPISLVDGWCRLLSVQLQKDNWGTQHVRNKPNFSKLHNSCTILLCNL